MYAGSPYVNQDEHVQWSECGIRIETSMSECCISIRQVDNPWQLTIPKRRVAYETQLRSSVDNGSVEEFLILTTHSESLSQDKVTMDGTRASLEH